MSQLKKADKAQKISNRLKSITLSTSLNTNNLDDAADEKTRKDLGGSKKGDANMQHSEVIYYDAAVTWKNK